MSYLRLGTLIAILSIPCVGLHSFDAAPGLEAKLQGIFISAGSSPQSGQVWCFEVLSGSPPLVIVGYPGCPDTYSTPVHVGGGKYQICVDLPRGLRGSRISVTARASGGVKTASWVVR